MILSQPDPAADPTFARLLLRLQHDAYRVEAALLGDDRLPPLAADEAELAAWRDGLMVAWEGTALRGAVAWTQTSDVVDVDRLVVAPGVHRRGIGTRLLTGVLERAAGRTATVSTARDNAPALALYRRLGFEVVAQEQAVTGLWLVHLRREPR